MRSSLPLSFSLSSVLSAAAKPRIRPQKSVTGTMGKKKSVHTPETALLMPKHPELEVERFPPIDSNRFVS